MTDKNVHEWIKCKDCAHWPRDVAYWTIRKGVCSIDSKARWPEVKRICPKYKEKTND